MAQKEFVGLAVDGKRLKVARLSLSGKTIRITHLEEVKLRESLDLSAHAPVRESQAEPEEDADSIFGIEEETEETPEEVSFEEEPEEAEEDDDEIFDLSDESEGTFDEPDTNEGILNNLLLGIDPKRVECAINIPLGSTVFNILRDRNYGDLKSKETQKIVQRQISTIYSDQTERVHTNHMIQGDGSLFIASYEGEIPLLQTLDQVDEFYSGKLFIREMLPDEMSLLGLIRENHTLEEEEITAVIAVSRNSSRILFLEGEKIRSILPLINEGSRSDRVLRTVFSKILLELDQENIPRLDRIILANQGQPEKRDFLEQQFPEVRVETLKLDEERVEVQPELQESLPEYASAIAVAWSAAGKYVEQYPGLSMLPEYVVDRQKVLKLEWHGMILIVLIALLPVGFNHFYQQSTSKLESLKDQKQVIWQQVEETRPLKQYADSLMAELSETSTKLQMLDTLTVRSLKWSKTLRMISDGLDQVNSTWLTEFSSNNEGIELSGYSLYRSRIPQLASLFAEVEIDEIVEEERRDVILYNFTMQIYQVVEDSTLFNPASQVETLTQQE